MHNSSLSLPRIVACGFLLFLVALAIIKNSWPNESVVLRSDDDGSDDVHLRHDRHRAKSDDDDNSADRDDSESDKHRHDVDRHERAKRLAKDRISTTRLVLDIKKVLLDVEATIKRRRERRQQHRASPEEHHASDEHHDDEKSNLREVDHIMDGLESLADVHHPHHQSASRDEDEDDTQHRHRSYDRRVRHDHDHDTDRDDSSAHHHDDDNNNKDDDDDRRHHSASQDGEEGRLLRNLRAAQSTHKPKQQKLTPAQEEKRKEIAAKMRALQEQIQHDFKKVTGFGNKAGYVPPPKIPSV